MKRWRTGGSPAPFIGPAGFGARLSINDTGDRTVVKEHLAAQLAKSLGPILFGLLAAYQWQQPGGPGLLRPLLVLIAGVLWWFGLQHLWQLLGRRRMEIQRADRLIRLFSFGQRVAEEIRLSEIGSVRIATSHRYFDDRRVPVLSYTLSVERRDGRSIGLCASDRREPLETIARLIGARRGDLDAGPPGGPEASPPPLPLEPAGTGTAARKRAGCQGCLALLLLYVATSMVLNKLPPHCGGRKAPHTEERPTSVNPRSGAGDAPPKPDLIPAAPARPVQRQDGSYVLGIDPQPTDWDELTLWRVLDGEEGERFMIPRDGLLTLVEAQIWTESDRGEVVASVYRRERERSVLLGSSRVAAGRFPRYPDSHQVHRLTPFPVAPPLPVRAGEVIDVMFAPTVESAVSGIMMKDACPGAVIAFHNGRPGIPEPVDWDYMARVTIVEGDGRAQPSGAGAAPSGSEGSTLIGATGPASLDGILMRNLGSGGEGQRFRIRAAGRLTLVEAALWAESGRGEIVATVYRVVGGEPREERRIAVPAGEFPGYGGIRSTNRLTPFRVDPPLPVAAGETIDVIFRTRGMEAVSGIRMTDAYPDAEMVFYNDRPGLPKPVAWDFIARATIESDTRHDPPITRPATAVPATPSPALAPAAGAGHGYPAPPARPQTPSSSEDSRARGW